MPRLSLYRPEKGNDFRFLDKIIDEQFQVGGTDVYVHKFLGPVNPTAGESSPTNPVQGTDSTSLGIQDVLLLENRDRHYDPDVFVIRGIYTMQDLEMNLAQFGLFVQNDTMLVNFHLKSSVDAIGRKLMVGDVLEFAHLRDEYSLSETSALKKFYVVQAVSRPASGFSATWYPHLVRVKCVPITDSQEFKEILDITNEDGTTVRDDVSTYQQIIDINDQIIAQADLDVAYSGYQTQHFFVLPEQLTNNSIDVAELSSTNENGSIDNVALDASIILRSPTKNLYVGYLTGDGIPPNGKPYSYGIAFPSSPVLGEFYLRTDYFPNRLFRWDGEKWNKFEDNVRMTLNNFSNDDVASGTFAGKPVRETQKTSFINNNNTATIAGEVIEERQALSKVLRPRADN